jgi:hypothetical protein
MENLIGRKAKGFEFSGYPTHTKDMDKYDGVVGEICNYTTGPVRSIRFPDGQYYNYPYPEILNHLVVEEELTIEQILNNIKKLTSEL